MFLHAIWLSSCGLRCPSDQPLRIYEQGGISACPASGNVSICSTRVAPMMAEATFGSRRNAPIKLCSLMFRELFQWLSNLLSGFSRSQVAYRLLLASPDTTPNGWASIE